MNTHTDTAHTHATIMHPHGCCTGQVQRVTSSCFLVTPSLLKMPPHTSHSTLAHQNTGSKLQSQAQWGLFPPAKGRRCVGRVMLSSQGEQTTSPCSSIRQQQEASHVTPFSLLLKQQRTRMGSSTGSTCTRKCAKPCTGNKEDMVQGGSLLHNQHRHCSAAGYEACRSTAPARSPQQHDSRQLHGQQV